MAGRPNLPRTLGGEVAPGNARSFSQNNMVDLTGEGNATGIVTSSAAQPRHGIRAATTPLPREVIDLDGDDNDGGDDDVDDMMVERPAKRMRMMDGGSESAMVASPTAIFLEHQEDTAHEVVSGTALPRPPRMNTPTGSQSRSNAATRKIPLSQRKANGLQAPPMSVYFPFGRGAADFAPWTGNHSEDIMNEQAVKAGYSDKPPVSTQSESNSAASILWPNLSQKNNIGLQTLSHLFVQVMEKRQAMGKVTAPSSFKPPPRVTVTDTKREAWLRDLSNLEVPLRKQSRTIPHGIRGKLLMEQCLAKSIPLQRAVWLAKCVGANELRAFKRKGVSGASATSGEGKWIREWTVQVEQFLESVVSSCGKVDGWREKMDYAVKLASHFYLERLLDCDHYLDWVVDSFGEASLEQLPVWTILSQLFWEGITNFGRRGRRLAIAIAKHLSRVGYSDHFKTLRQRLQRLLVVMAATKRASLIVPYHWHECKDLISTVLRSAAGKSRTAELAIENVIKRNEHLIGLTQSKSCMTASPALKVIRLLDGLDLNFNASDVASRCLALLPDASRLMTLVLDWASSTYRHGQARIYMGPRIIRELAEDEISIDSMVLGFLRQKSACPTTNPRAVYAVVSELVRFQAFSVGNFVQWALTSGALYTASAASGLIAGLLQALPVDHHSINMRKTLLRRLGVEPVSTASNEMMRQVQKQLASCDGGHAPINAPNLRTITSEGKADMSYWIQGTIHRYSRSTILTLTSFVFLRGLLEQLEDIPVMVQLLHCAAGADATSTLSSVTETLSYNADAIAALDELIPLLDRLIDRHRTLRTQQPLERSFVLALTNLVKRIPEKAALVQPLTQDLAYCDQQNSIMVCSPASDNMTGMHASHLDSEADIDAVFASGNTMDEQLIQRVFMRVMQQAEKTLQWPTTETSSKLGGWLTQLRSLDAHTFDGLVRDFVRTFASGATVAGKIPHSNAILVLVAVSCVSIEDAVEALWNANTSAAAVVAINLLALPLPEKSLHRIERYRFGLHQKLFAEQTPHMVVSILRRACSDPKFPVNDQHVCSLAAWLAVHSGESVFEAQNVTDNTQALRCNNYKLCRQIFTRAIAVNRQGMLDVGTIMQHADALSEPFCSAMIRMTSSSIARDSELSEDLKSRAIQAVIDDSQVWPQLLAALDSSHSRDVNLWAREQLMSSSIIESVSQPENVPTNTLILAMSITRQEKEDDSDLHTLAALATRVRGHERQLTEVSGLAYDSEAFKACFDSLQVSLQLCAQHLDATRFDNEALAVKKATLLGALCALLLHPQLQAHQAMLEYIFDIASSLSDSLSSEAVCSIARAASPAVLSTSPRIVSILGTSISPDAWLALAFRPQPPGSQQQRLLSRQPSQQPQQSQPIATAAFARQAHGQSPQPQQQPPQGRLTPQVSSAAAAAAAAARSSAQSEAKTVPYILRRWETMPDPTPVMGENDTSLSMGLFAARRA
ncbi:hypothetical protein K431DRAFT_226647 [Polychaeton citri CBS 116435]|uniref:Mediator of RNA polymerase II transcription subunit 12 n=1 Tax=Polychaeton citri CBS 116435 TaxID=1314669 RepID=A0A9P4UPU4_9PEZI|nr:hypothetical protein K431DRAFT_226647 [Polychaeton citri CBS 116435]